MLNPFSSSVRKSNFGRALVLVFLSCLPAPGLAQQQSANGYPARPVRMVLGITPGGGTDVVARAVAQKLTERWGRTFVVDNRPGANGVIAMTMVAQAAPDGYTLFVGTTDNVATATPMKKVSFDMQKAYVPVAQMDTQPYLLTSNPAQPFNSLKELIAYAKTKPGVLNYGSSGAGTQSHLGMELFRSLAGVDVVHVPYKGVSVAVVDVISGQIQLMLASAVSAGPHVRSGKIRALVVTDTRRSQAYPDVPNAVESGLPGFVIGNTHAIFVPAGTPADIVRVLNREIHVTLKSPDVIARLAADGAEPLPPTTPDEFKVTFAGAVARWEKFFRQHPALVKAQQ